MSIRSGRRRALTSVVLALTTTVTMLTSTSWAATSPTRESGCASTGQPAASGQPASTGPVIVKLASAPAAAGVAEAVRAAVARCSGSVLSVQQAVGSMVVTLPAGASAVVMRVPGVLSVTPDRTARPMALGFDPATQGGSMTGLTRSTGAQYLWGKGLTGAGVDVALIDTGVAPVPALSDKDKVVVGPDLSFESQDANLRYLDTFGHGTHMGSIIAGREVPKSTGAAYAKDTKNFYGVAPDARLVSVKVGSSDGAVDVSQLIAAIDWVVQNKNANGLNIKVLNLSFGTDSTQSWQTDPLSQAAEVAARSGILVVAAAGNDGEKARGLADPAYNPYVMAVGAVNTKGTDAYGDDEVPSFSQHMDKAYTDRHPDLVAPGYQVVAPAVPGSALAMAYPKALVGGGKFIRGSGTSQAAAFMSGAAALIWQKWPKLTPLQIREMMVDNTNPLGSATEAYEGEGETSLVEGWAEQPAASDKEAASILGITTTLTGKGTGTLQGARGSQSVSIDGVVLKGEQDIFGKAWDGSAMGPLTAAFKTWLLPTGVFNGNAWIGAGFTTDTTTVAGRTWNGRSWSGRSWTGTAWSGRSWAGRSWSGRSWSGGAWTGASWGDPVTLSDNGWSSRSWSSRLWD